MAVVNHTGQPIWVGGGGGALRALCATSEDNQCIPEDGHYGKSSCDCGSGSSHEPTGALACPGSSVPTFDGKNCQANIGQNCGLTAAPNPENQNFCYFELPEPTRLGGSQVLKRTAPSSWNWQLANGGEADFCVTAARIGSADSEVWWSGGVFARMGCEADGTHCATGDCVANPNSNCPAGKGGGNPATLAEFTLQRTHADFYDISMINGANAAEQMVPLPQPTQAPDGRVADAYWCQAPGAKQGAAGGKNCNWDLAPYVAKVPSGPGGATSDQTALLLNSTRLCQTDPGSPETCPAGYTCTGENGTCVQTCTTNSDCNGGECDSFPGGRKFCQCKAQKDCASSPLGKFCGSQFGVGLGFYLQECGPFEGWWSADDFCSDPATSYGPFNCGQLFTDGGGTNQTNLSSLFLCADKNGNPANGTSCYDTGGPTDECCGCATSNVNNEYAPPLGKYWPAPTCANQASNPTCCENNNSVWASKVQPWLANLKQSCPTAYTYAFDDLTSTYQCQAKGNINLLGYQITFSGLVAPTPQRLARIANKAAKEQSGQ